MIVLLALEITRNTKITIKYIYLRKNKTWSVKRFCSIPHNNTHDFENVVKLSNKFSRFFLQHQAYVYILLQV